MATLKITALSVSPFWNSRDGSRHMGVEVMAQITVLNRPEISPRSEELSKFYVYEHDTATRLLGEWVNYCNGERDELPSWTVEL